MRKILPTLAQISAYPFVGQGTSTPVWSSTPALCRQQKRLLLTLAIESSCDDTSVAVLEKQRDYGGRVVAKLHYHEKVTSNNLAYRGVHPAVALVSHQRSLAKLVQQALKHLPQSNDLDVDGNEVDRCHARRPGKAAQAQVPDFVSVTRGPGMRSNLSVGLDTAKGLSLAWRVPLVAVNHMQAHALTPRLVTALDNSSPCAENTGHKTKTTPGIDSTVREPSFPFLSLLVSGGHTMLIHSKSICDHPTLAATSDVAIGDYMDKVAREVLPVEVLRTARSAMYGPLLERFAFPPTPRADIDYNYTPPSSRQEHLQRRMTPYGWGLAPPLSLGDSGRRSRDMEFSFAGLGSAIKRIITDAAAEGRHVSSQERQLLAQEAQRVAFEHLASRVVMALEALHDSSAASESDVETARIRTLVVSGGVAANRFLKHLLRAYLDVHGHRGVEIVFPPMELCTDNAAMIAWAGMEMYEAGWRSELSCEPLRKWSLDPGAADGGVLGVGDWVRVNEANKTRDLKM